MIQADGLAIARERIAEEAKAHTWFLDLGRLGLTELPKELFTLKHLQRLNLGSGMSSEDKQLLISFVWPIRRQIAHLRLQVDDELPHCAVRGGGQQAPAVPAKLEALKRG